MGYSEIGNAASCLLQEIQERRPNINVDGFIVMPNHIHCVIEIDGNSFSFENTNQYGKPIAGSISTIVNQYKGAVKKWCNVNEYSALNGNRDSMTA
jgi:REP element-mobilizing transposase RayT